MRIIKSFTKALNMIEQLRSHIELVKGITEELLYKRNNLIHIYPTSHIGCIEKDLLTGKETWTHETFDLMGIDVKLKHSFLDILSDFVPLEDLDQLMSAVEYSIQNAKPYDITFRVQSLDGEQKIIRAQGDVFCDYKKRPLRMLIILFDVTHSKYNLHAQKELDPLLNQLDSDYNRELLWVRDTNMSKLLFVSGNCKSIWGISTENLYQNPKILLDSIYPEDRPKLEHCLTSNTHLKWHCEYRIKSADEKERWIHDRSFPIYDEQGNVLKVMGVASDITQKMQAKNKLAAQYIELKTARDSLEILNRKLEDTNRLLEERSVVDPLTGIFNRRYVDQYINQEWRREGRQGKVISILLVDIDYFKNYNDLYGHTEGDRVLKQVAKTLSQVLKRPSDFAARYGGEEFLIILPETEEAGANALAHDLLAQINDLRIPHKGSPSQFLTLSIGIATIDPVKIDATRAIELADMALYDAKENGRNAIISYQ